MSTLAAVLNQEPKPVIESTVPAVPRDLERIINRCLRKDPARRFQHMGDLKVELEELKEESDSGRLAEAPPVVRPARRLWVWAGAATRRRGDSRRRLALSRELPENRQAAPEVVPLTSYAGF